MRLDALRATMAREAVDLVALGPGAHLAWLLGVRPHADERPLLCIVTSGYAGFLMPALEADSARRQTDRPFVTWSDEEGPHDAFARLLRDAGAENAREVVLDETMRADFAALVQDALPGATRRFAASTLGALRMRKDEDEYTSLRRNARIADRAMRTAWDAMAIGMTEREVADVVGASFAGAGAIPLFGIVGAGGNGAFPHHRSGETRLAAGDAVVMDIGARSEGYSSDITRMALVGGAPDGYDEVHAVVEAAVRAALAASVPGAEAHAVDDAAREVISAAGHGEHFVHRTGHGLGVEGHEPPWITATSRTVLEEGMVFSIEPGIYLPGRFGIRLEEIVILRAEGPEILSALPRDARRIR